MFLEIITRCYRRPQMLRMNIESLRRQTSTAWRQTFLVDNVGRGVGWANAQLADVDPMGDYVWLLDDDDLCACPSLVADLRYIVLLHEPAAIMLKTDHGPLGVLPDADHWGFAPVEGCIGVSAIVTRKDAWLRHRDAWRSARYASDYDFIDAVYTDQGADVYWHDCVASAVQRISRGEPEHATA